MFNAIATKTSGFVTALFLMFQLSVEAALPALSARKETNNGIQPRECCPRFSHAEKLTSRFFRYNRLLPKGGKSHGNKIALRSLCPVLALHFQKIDKSSKLQPTATRYWKTSFPNAEPRFSPISKRGLQRVGVVFLLLFAVESKNILYICRSRLFSIRVW